MVDDALEHLQWRCDVGSAGEVNIVLPLDLGSWKPSSREQKAVVGVPFFGRVTRCIVAIQPDRDSNYPVPLCNFTPAVPLHWVGLSPWARVVVREIQASLKWFCGIPNLCVALVKQPHQSEPEERLMV